MTAKQISIPTPDGPFAGYLATPTSGRGPGIVVIQEIFGVNQVMRDIADGLAAHGYFGREAETATAIASWMLHRPFPKDIE